ncbi:nickel transporter, partial [Streptomyces longispororuber]|nr:nickel transporter [Streptomyces longispororuber]
MTTPSRPAPGAAQRLGRRRPRGAGRRHLTGAPRRRRPLRWAVLVLLAATALLLTPTDRAAAHPLGNFTTNTYDGLVTTPTQLRVDHVEDLAEIPATQAEPAVKRKGRT